MSVRTPDRDIEVTARLTARADGRYSDARGWTGLADGNLPMRRFGDGLRKVRVDGIEAQYSQVAARPPALLVAGHVMPLFSQQRRLSGTCPRTARREGMFTWSAPPARALRRTFYRMIDNNTGLNRRFRRDPPAHSRHGPDRPGCL